MLGNLPGFLSGLSGLGAAIGGLIGNIVHSDIDLSLSIIARPAIFLYHAAILLSMVLGELLEQLELHHHSQRRITAGEKVATTASAPTGRGGPFPVLRAAPAMGACALLLSLGRLGLALGAVYGPLFTVEGFGQLPPALLEQLEHAGLTLLIKNTWSLSEGISTLLEHQSGFQVIFGIDMAIFTIAVPLLSACLALWCVVAPCGPAPTRALWFMHGLARFGNLEVVLSAMALYLAEMYELITLELHAGFVCLVLYVPLLIGSLVCTTHAVRAAEAYEAAGTKRAY